MDIEEIKPKLEQLQRAEAKVAANIESTETELGKLQKIQWDTMCAKQRHKNDIADCVKQIRLAQLKLQDAKKELEAGKPVAADWTKDDLFTLKLCVVKILRSWLNRPSLELEDLTTTFLFLEVKKVKLVELWDIMQDGEFAVNPLCPHTVKDKRPGYHKKLVGISDVSKLTIVGHFESALRIPSTQDDDE